MTYCVSSVDEVGLPAERKIFLAREHLVNELAVEHSNLRLVLLQLVGEQVAALFDLLSGQVGAALGRPGYHVGKTDAQLEHVVVVVRRHRLRRNP